MDSFCETQMLHNKRRYVRGGKDTCSKSGCDQPRAPGSGYCRDHKNAYWREWSKQRTEALKAMRIAEQK